MRSELTSGKEPNNNTPASRIVSSNRINSLNATENKLDTKKSWKKLFKKSQKNKVVESQPQPQPHPHPMTHSQPQHQKTETFTIQTGSMLIRDIPKPEEFLLPKIDSEEPTDQSTIDLTFETPSASSATVESEAVSKFRAILSRKFTRASIPKEKGWVVEVSPAEWDADQSRWKYRILVQRRQFLMPINNQTPKSFTAAFTWRSLADFAWLENALRAEYHGALVLPLLSIAVGTPDLVNAQYEVDAYILKDWLGDVLNGVRGQGELLLNQRSVDLISSEALEAFLYRNADPLLSIPIVQHPKSMSFVPSPSTLDSPWKYSAEKETRESSFVELLCSKPFRRCGMFENLCHGTCVPLDTEKSLKSTGLQRIPVEIMRANCSSRAIGDTTTLEIQDSFVRYDPIEMDSSKLATHYELLEAEHELVEFNRISCLTAMERLRLLKEEESQVAGAWKRFAISLSNLFSYEKEVENSRVGDKKEGRVNMPYRKLSKSTVDESLRVMARQKLERSISSLGVMDVMLGAYVADLTAIEPSMRAYSGAVRQLSRLDDSSLMAQEGPLEVVQKSWSGPIKSLMSLVEPNKHQDRTNSLKSIETTGSTIVGEILPQRRAFEKRVFSNGRMLRESLTTLCRATPIRMARIAYKYFNAEATQATLLSSSAISLRKKINVFDDEILHVIRERQHKNQEVDDKSEKLLVQRLIDIGNSTKFENNQISAQKMQKDVVNNTINSKEQRRRMLRAKAIHMAEERIGKWDSNLALAIMEAAGVDDAEVQVEETTRDLRLVRRHAIGLRENLSRCVEALTVLRSSILYGQYEGMEAVPSEGAQSIKKSRIEFVDRISILFSGGLMYAKKKDQQGNTKSSSHLLQSAGIDMDDPAGWLVERSTKKSRGNCGVVIYGYFNIRDSAIEELLDSLEAELEDYRKRVENIESYVYMQCVGIQLEKHFSKKRAEALTAFEKKTDIQTAINIAQRKRLPLLVQELNAKMEAVVPAGITHTAVKEAKEAHLLSKTLKSEIGHLALRRFQKSKECAMNRVVSLLNLWAKYEETECINDLKVLNKAADEVEKSLKYIDVSSDGLSHFVELKEKKPLKDFLAET